MSTSKVDRAAPSPEWLPWACSFPSPGLRFLPYQSSRIRLCQIKGPFQLQHNVSQQKRKSRTLGKYLLASLSYTPHKAIGVLFIWQWQDPHWETIFTGETVLRTKKISQCQIHSKVPIHSDSIPVETNLMSKNVSINGYMSVIFSQAKANNFPQICS